jgi:WD40 repeat protein
MRDVFISYSRKDKPFVEKLHQALEAQNRDAWVDWEDIPLSAKWWHEIQRGIEGANTFVFVISRDSVESKVCRDEIDHAVLHNKRLVPIVRRDDFEMAKVHPNLALHNWLFFRETDEFESGLQALLKVIETDLEYVRAHTRLLERAIEWQEQKRNESFGLKGDDLRSAEAWLSQGETKEPKPTELQQNYIRASRSTEDANEEAKRILERAVAKAKRVSLLSLLAVGAAVSAAAIAIPASMQAQKQAAEARSQMQEANKNLVETQAKEQAAAQKAQVAQQQFERAQQKQQAAETEAKQAAEKTRMAQQQARVAAQQLAQVNQEKAVAAEAKARAEQQLQVAQVELNRAQEASIAAQQKTEKAESDLRIAADKRDTILAVNRLEQDGVSALKRSGFEQVKGLLDAMRSGEDLQSLMKTKGQEGFAASPILALQTILDTVENRAGRSFQTQTLLAHESGVNAAQFSPDGQRIVTASGDNTARIWDAKTGQELAKLSGHEFSVRAAQFSPDGQRIVTASWDKTARIWDAKTGQELAKLSGHESMVNAAQFSPDGQRIVTASGDNTARIWDAKTGQELVKLSGHESMVNAAQFSPDGQRIVTASGDNTARIWDAKTRQELAKLSGHEDSVRAAQFSPDGQRIVTASGDNTARIWDARTGQELAKLSGHEDNVNAAQFSPDGQRIITASDDKTARVVPVEDLDALLARGCRWLTNYLIVNPQQLKQLPTCQQPALLLASSPTLVRQSETTARAGKLQEATEGLTLAKQWNPNLSFDPKTRAQNLATAAQLLDEGDRLAKAGKISEAIAKYRQAQAIDESLKFDPEARAKENAP